MCFVYDDSWVFADIKRGNKVLNFFIFQWTSLWGVMYCEISLYHHTYRWCFSKWLRFVFKNWCTSRDCLDDWAANEWFIIQWMIHYICCHDNYTLLPEVGLCANVCLFDGQLVYRTSRSNRPVLDTLNRGNSSKQFRILSFCNLTKNIN